MRIHLPVAILLVTVVLAGCVYDGLSNRGEQGPSPREARLAELQEAYQNGTGRLLSLADFPAGADWVAIDLVVTEPVERLSVALTEDDLPGSETGLEDPEACLGLYYKNVGGWIWTSGDGYAADTHLMRVPAPMMRLSDGSGGADWAFEAPEPLLDHRVVVSVDDADAWLEGGFGFDIETVGNATVYWRIADHGSARCALHMADMDDGGAGLRVAGAGAAYDIYDRWSTDSGGLMFLLWEADQRYHVYIVWNDEYALAEWDSEATLATGGGYVFPVAVSGRIGVYAPVLAGVEDTYLMSFYMDGYSE